MHLNWSKCDFSRFVIFESRYFSVLYSNLNSGNGLNLGDNCIQNFRGGVSSDIRWEILF